MHLASGRTDQAATLFDSDGLRLREFPSKVPDARAPRLHELLDLRLALRQQHRLAAHANGAGEHGSDEQQHTRVVSDQKHD